MKLLLYGMYGSKVKTFENIDTWENIAINIFNNTDFEDDVFVVLDNDNNILYRSEFDSWKEEQFLNHNGVRVEF